MLLWIWGPVRNVVIGNGKKRERGSEERERKGTSGRRTTGQALPRGRHRGGMECDDTNFTKYVEETS